VQVPPHALDYTIENWKKSAKFTRWIKQDALTVAFANSFMSINPLCIFVQNLWPILLLNAQALPRRRNDRLVRERETKSDEQRGTGADWCVCVHTCIGACPFIVYFSARLFSHRVNWWFLAVFCFVGSNLWYSQNGDDP